jgi:hypothetical protein
MKLEINVEIQHSQFAESVCAVLTVGDAASCGTTVGARYGRR